MAKHQEGDVIVDGIGRTFVVTKERQGRRRAVALQADVVHVGYVATLPRPLTLVVRHGEPLGGIEVRS